MSYEVDSRTPYRADCACGKGFLRYYKISLSNEWFQTREDTTEVEICCVFCKEKYHYQCGYLVPKGLSFPSKYPQIDYKDQYNREEKIVQEYGKEGIEAIIGDMTAPKHTYIKNLTTEEARSFAQKWYRWTQKKKLAPMVSFLQNILKEFDSIKTSSDKKKVILDGFDKACIAYEEEKKRVKEQSFMLFFQYDSEQDKAEQEKAKREREAYKEAHEYDDFTANVKYDPSYKKDWTNQYWDTYLIEECTDSQYLVLNKSIIGSPEITIAKKYMCICQLCGEKREFISSNFRINFNSEIGYSPEPCCSCHCVSSFEAKVMEILNNLGILYIREKSFDGLVGDSGRNLRFDFCLYRNCDRDGIPMIDLAIELQGPHHYKEGYYDEYGDFVTEYDKLGINLQERFERQIRYDQKKKEFCVARGINLECIKYTVSNDYERLEKKLIEILQNNGYDYFVECGGL